MPRMIPAMETTATTRTASIRLNEGLAALRELDLPPAAHPMRDAAFDVAEIVRTLEADDDVVMAAALQPLLDGKYIEREAAEKRFGVEPVRLARALAQLGHFGLAPDWTPERGLEAGQAEALRMVTSVAAEVIGLGHRKGRIAPGFDADILVVDGDPVADLAALHRIRAVYAGGTLVPV